MTSAIRVENLSKRFVIQHQRRERFTTLRDSLASGARRLGERLTGKAVEGSVAEEDFWALRNVSFEISQGDRVGIIGRNGAGKSTLLKILSRITDPTEGRITISGKMASLLEVGTGFHPELTGRENIFLNGAILGMARAEIRSKFDEIVDFAGVEKFLDTPVKRYSSGMYVRLAFAVGANLDPEILVVDEVLAVGDAEFQRKCLGKMEEVGNSGRTVLFVSHNLPTVLRLCPRSLLLENGSIVASGDTRTVIESYLDSKGRADGSTNALMDLPRAPGMGERLRFTTCAIVNSDGNSTDRLLFGEPFTIRIEARGLDEIRKVSIVLGFDTQGDFRITTLASEDASKLFSCAPEGMLRVTVDPTHLLLKPGRYFLTLGARNEGKPLDHLHQILRFEVDSIPWRSGPAIADTWGIVYVRANWRVDSAEPAISVVEELADD